MSERIHSLLESAPVSWDASISSMSDRERDDLTAELSSVMEKCGRLKGYIEGRFLFAKRPHEAGVYASNKLGARVRKLLGFAYPQQDITF